MYLRVQFYPMSKTTLALIIFFIMIAVAGTYIRSSQEQASKKRVETIATIAPEAAPVSEPTLSPALQSIPATHAWFSSAYHFPSSPLYSYPGVYKVYEKGLGISIPQVKTSEKTVSGVYEEMCVLNSGEAVSTSRVVAYGDWHVELGLGEGESEFKVALVQGMPQTYFTDLKEIHVSCPEATITKEGEEILIKRGEAALLVQGSGDAKSEVKNDTEAVLVSSDKVYRITVLPSVKELKLFSEQAWNPVFDTQVKYQINDSTITTTYSIVSADNNPILTTLFPHQGQVQGAQEIEKISYNSVFGPLRLVLTSGFSTTLPRPDLSVQFKKVNKVEWQKKIKAEIEKDAALYGQENLQKGIYDEGTRLGALASLAQLSDLYEMKELRNKLAVVLQKELAESLANFSYDDKKKMLTVKNAELENENGRNQHSQYGYYIRAAAILASLKPETIASNSAVVNEMIADSASINEGKYPRLRAYSAYEGHSWADVEGNLAEGNNLASSSESLNAWYGMWLWGNATRNDDLKKQSEWLFSQELSGTKAYWFGLGNAFPAGYTYPIASLVWGGKREFGSQPLHSYGTQFLPITPASKYLKQVSDGFVIEAHLRPSGNAASQEWGDLYVAYLSYFNADGAEQQLSAVNSYSGLQLRSLLYQTVYSNKEQ